MSDAMPSSLNRRATGRILVSSEPSALLYADVLGQPSHPFIEGLAQAARLFGVRRQLFLLLSVGDRAKQGKNHPRVPAPAPQAV